MVKKARVHKVVIGRAEELNLVELDVFNIPAKIDTGAYRSAIHATNIKLDKDKKILSFTLLGDHPVCGALAVDMKVRSFQKVSISNSFGDTEERYEIKMKVKFGPKTFRAAFTLADRSRKIYPVLIGRKVLNKRYVVDTSHAGIHRGELKRKYGILFPKDEEQGRK